MFFIPLSTMKKLSYLIILFNCLINAQCYQKISTGDAHVLLLKSDNSIWGFGSNQTGELANQSGNYTLTPSSVSNLQVWEEVFGGYLRSFFIKQNGTLWATGSNSFGSLGINSTSSTNVITQIGSATNWMKIVGSPTHTVGLKEDGTLWGWGQNNDYELGQGQGNNNLSQLTPIQIGTDNHWVDVAVTDSGTFVLKNDGTFWGCGYNSNVILGFLGNFVYSLSQGPSDNWSKIKAGVFFILAQKTDGTLWAWGSGSYGQVGNGQFNGSLTPFQITTDTWKDFATGSLRSYGIKTDGTLWAWGRNLEGQLGDGTFENRNVPTQIGTDNNWDRIYAQGATTTVGVKTDGTVWVWGSNDFGQFGNGTLNQGSNVPLQNNALCTLGVADFDDEKGSVSFYPNPAQDVVQFTYNELPNAKFEVFDLNGRLMYQTKTIGFRGQLAIPVAQWSRGVYVFKIVSENREIIKKMVLN
jgi:alpha-tubulin suppressor-like RCC1 family protein